MGASSWLFQLLERRVAEGQWEPPFLLTKLMKAGAYWDFKLHPVGWPQTCWKLQWGEGCCIAAQ